MASPQACYFGERGSDVIKDFVFKANAKAKDLGSRSRPRTQKVKDKTKDIKQPIQQHTLPYHKEYSMSAKRSVFNMQLM